MKIVSMEDMLRRNVGTSRGVVTTKEWDTRPENAEIGRVQIFVQVPRKPTEARTNKDVHK